MKKQHATKSFEAITIVAQVFEDEKFSLGDLQTVVDARFGAKTLKRTVTRNALQTMRQKGLAKCTGLKQDARWQLTAAGRSYDRIGDPDVEKWARKYRAQNTKKKETEPSVELDVVEEEPVDPQIAAAGPADEAPMLTLHMYRGHVRLDYGDAADLLTAMASGGAA